MTDEARTAEERTQDYTAMGHSVDLINDVIKSTLCPMAV